MLMNTIVEKKLQCDITTLRAGKVIWTQRNKGNANHIQNVKVNVLLNQKVFITDVYESSRNHHI